MKSIQVKTVELAPIKESSEDYEAIEKAIKILLKKEIYYPILRELDQKQTALQNARLPDSLAMAIKFGRIQFSRGVFSGKFSASISRELKKLGAQWERRTATFRLPQAALPIEVRHAILSSQVRFQEKLSAIDKQLSKIVPEGIADKLKVSKLFDTALWKVDRDFQKTVKGLTVAPKLTPERRLRLADEWQNNMKLWIKDFTEKEIVELRKNMQKTVFAGNRYESAVKTIQKSYGVSANKAKFLARQETSLLMTKFKESRYTDSGVMEYKWSCVAGSKNHPVRPWHKALEGKVFTWDNPPITTKPGEPVRRNNPGQDYNCRCFARPIVKFKGSTK